MCKITLNAFSHQVITQPDNTKRPKHSIPTSIIEHDVTSARRNSGVTWESSVKSTSAARSYQEMGNANMLKGDNEKKIMFQNCTFNFYSGYEKSLQDTK